MKKAVIIGASGYSGAQLCVWLSAHPSIAITGLYVSEHSQDANKAINHIHPNLTGRCDLSLQPLTERALNSLADTCDVVFLATPHEASHDWVPNLLQQGLLVLDLSGAYRLHAVNLYQQHYGFNHQHSNLLQIACYGLAEWYQQQLQQADLIAVPGCYPTASLLSLLPIKHWIAAEHPPIINAVSGVSGAGRKASLATSLCEVSLQAYGVHQHRHQPEISQYLGAEVLFTPHLGQFKRGILATIHVKLGNGVSQQQVDQAYQQAYAEQPLIRLLPQWPKVDDVAGTPYCDLHWQLNERNGYLIVSCAIDNLLKGAATQAIQCANIRLGLNATSGLLGGVHG